MTGQSILVPTVLAAGLLTVPAQAAAVPTYTCDRLGGDPGTARLLDNCAASPGAVTNSDFAGESVLESRTSNTRIRCSAGGKANVPHEVIAFECQAG